MPAVLETDDTVTLPGVVFPVIVSSAPMASVVPRRDCA